MHENAVALVEQLLGAFGAGSGGIEATCSPWWRGAVVKVGFQAPTPGA